MESATLEGRTLGKYQVLAPLGAGGMARVYRAYHPQLDRYVAIKVLRSDLVLEAEFLTRFQREAQAVAALRHPNIVQVFDFDIEGELYYMVLELLEGDTLKAQLRECSALHKVMSTGEAARVMLDTLAGLEYAHNEGVIHRDLKPANLMLTRRGQAVLTDFGIAQIIGGPKQTITGTLMGTLNYMAPEQGLQGQWDRRSDLYSLGVVLYEMLTGHVPFDADTPLAILLKHVNETLPLPHTLNPDIPEAFEHLLLKALSKQPADRYQTAREMSVAIQTALQAAQVPLPESIPANLGQADTKPIQSVAVFSGASRAALAPTGLTNDDTDVGLGLPLAKRQVETATPGPVPNTRETVSARKVDRAVYIVLGAFVVVNLLSLALGGTRDNMALLMGRVWPVEIYLVAFLLSMLMESLASIWFVIPISLMLNVGLLLNYYVLTQQWQRWFWWPLLTLVIAGEVIAAVRWAWPARRQRARQLGLAVSLFIGGLILLCLCLAFLAASR